MPRWALIADDLTGALDTALQFRKAGLSTRVATRAGAWPPDDDCVATTTESRRLEPDEAAQRIGRAVRALRLTEPSRIYKKTDSLLRGNIGPELASLLDATGTATIVYAPAFPTGGRTTIDGRQLLWGTPVHQSSPGRDAVTPVTESHIPTLIESTSGLSAESVPLAITRGGEGALAKALIAARDAGIRVAVPDIETDEDLATVAAALDLAENRRMCAGSAGLAEHLGRRGRPPDLTGIGLDRATHVAAMVGTPAEHTRRQLAYLESTCSVERIPITPVRDERAAVMDRARRAWRSGRNVVFDAVIGKPDPTTGDEEAQREAIAGTARALLREVPDLGLVVTGGETAMAVFEGLESETVLLTGEVEWGVAAGVAALRHGPGMPIVTKGGTMGGESALVTALECLGPPVATPM